MADDQTTQQPAGTPATTPDGAQNTQGNALPQNVPYERFREVNEAKKAAEERLQKLLDAEKERELEAAKKRGDFETIINDLKPKAERADNLEATLKKYLDGEISTVPEQYRGLIPGGDVTMQLEWIRQAKAQGLFGKPTPPPTDAGASGDPKPVIKLSDYEREMARIAGMTDEEYAKYKQ